MLDDMRVLGLQPLVLPLDLDTLFALDDGIMRHTGELQLVALGTDRASWFLGFGGERILGMQGAFFPKTKRHLNNWSSNP